MSDLVTLTIDGVEVQVPKGTLVVDAAKRIDNDIPVFCYHPKMEPVGMCRMCLVEIGRPMFDRETREPLLNEDGTPQLMFRGMETACTVPVSEGMVVRGTTPGVVEARKNVIEFILTSHPLDCPVCDKGGECPLQNLTMSHGAGESRFGFDDKMKLDKHVPLGDLIFLDRERCIQCGRCVRYQDEIVDDPVIAFHNRGRRLEIVTLSDPGFDSVWSGNTTDICPVGALTTADFRFGARPWELTASASLCNHCPVGCNTTLSTRREAKSGGRIVIKRIMPRQNESVNEIWICDKGRFVHHFAEAAERLTKPLVRKQGQLVEATWDEALTLVANKLRAAGDKSAALANDRLANEELYLLRKLFEDGLGSGMVALADPRLGGGEVVADVGIAGGSNLGDLGAGDAILVAAADLHEAAPVWWLRVKQAADRGATVVVVNHRPTRLDRHARFSLQTAPGELLQTVRQLLNAARVEGTNGSDLSAAAEALIQAQNLVVFYGGEGLTYDESAVLARILGNLLLLQNRDGVSHAGRPNNGLIPVWPRANTQGAWDVGVGAGDSAAVYGALDDGTVDALYLLGADPVGQGRLANLDDIGFVVVQELFLTETAALADVVLPAQSWAEREGTYTSGERRVQRFFPAITPYGESRADWQIVAQVAEKLGMGKPAYACGLVFKQLAAEVAAYAGMSYRSLARWEKQWPDVGGEDLYYGGNSYENKSGLGQQSPVAAESGEVAAYSLPDVAAPATGLQAMHIPAVYATGRLITYTDIVADHVVGPTVHMHAADAADLGIDDGAPVTVTLGETQLGATARVGDAAPPGLALLQGTPYVAGTQPAGIVRAEPVAAD